MADGQRNKHRVNWDLMQAEHAELLFINKMSQLVIDLICLIR